MAEMFVANCHICGTEVGQIHEGSLILTCPVCDTKLYIKCNREVLTIRKAKTHDKRSQSKL